jgi:hypothetical protein
MATYIVKVKKKMEGKKLFWGFSESFRQCQSSVNCSVGVVFVPGGGPGLLLPEVVA